MLKLKGSHENTFDDSCLGKLGKENKANNALKKAASTVCKTKITQMPKLITLNKKKELLHKKEYVYLKWINF